MNKSRIENLINYLNKAFQKNAGLWSHSVLDILEKVSVKEGIWKEGKIHSIWEITNHLIFWKEYIVSLLEGKEPSEEDYKISEEASEEEWKNTVERLKNSHEKLINLLKNKTDEDLDKPFGEYGTLEENLYGILSHDCYHLGQIVIILQLMGIEI
ncbi:MAG: DinB family protein [Dictyoglomaceae bacterium]|nr:DinB family protein [Dictyoglomaceae bacterium]